MTAPLTPPSPSASPLHEASPHAPRARRVPGERRLQILQTLATMLEEPTGERITTALLAKRLSLSEAALYRHFASKAQMFEGLISFIEQSVFGLINQIEQHEPDGRRQCAQIAVLVLQFGEKNRGMTRVMVGEALLYENPRLGARMSLFFDKLESRFKQSLRESFSNHPTPTVQANTRAAALVALLLGRLQLFVRSGFRRSPTEHMSEAIGLIV